MRIRGFWGAAFGLVALVACSAPDPGVDPIGPHHNNALNGGGTSNNNNNNNTGTDSGVSNNPPPDNTPDSSVAADTGAADTGTTSGGTNAFSGQPAFSTDAPTDKAANHHTQAAQGFTNPAGQDCMTCHKAGGTGTQFAFGGTVYQSATSTTGAPDVEVRVVDSTGKEQGTAHSDTDGNFWVVSTTALPSGALAGARNAASTQLMISAATGACNNCHKTGGIQAPMHVP